MTVPAGRSPGVPARESSVETLSEQLPRLLRLTAAAKVHLSSDTRDRAALVDEGLVRRVTDESDGRATRLVVTDAGSTALDQLGRDRAAVADRITADRRPGDLATFTGLLGRFLDDLAAALPGDAASTPVTGDLR